MLQRGQEQASSCAKFRDGIAATGPGHWNDPDKLEIGNGNLTAAEDRSHMALWVVSAAPLIAGNHLSAMGESTRALLVNPEVVAVDQDPAGVLGVKVVDREHQVWARPVTLAGGRAVVLFNPGDAPENATVRWSDVGLAAGPARVRDLIARQDRGTPQDPVRAVDAALDGARELRLFVEPAGRTSAGHFADWGNARITCR